VVIPHTAAVHRPVAGRMLALAAATLIGGLALVHPPLARAADLGLQIVVNTEYTALPAQGRVHVVLDAVATNLKPDPPNGRYYFSAARFTVQPAIRNVRATSAGAPLAARVIASTAAYTAIEVTFAHALFHDASYGFSTSFDITDPGGVPQRDVRVARSLVAFPVWAFGSEATPGGTVTVTLPAGYAVTVEAGEMTKAAGERGTTVLTATSIPDPFAFFAYVTAEGPNAFKDNELHIPIPPKSAAVLVRSWVDDPDWGQWVSDLMVRGLPVLHQMIGLDYDVGTRLVVEEAAASRLQDYAGEYHDVTKLIDLRYDADGTTALHEAAHIWFNDRLLADRWIEEAWAEWYAVQAGAQLHASGQPFKVTAELRKHKIALNAWGAVGTEDAATELYAYSASYELASKIASRTDLAGLRAVWAAARAYETAYQPVHASQPETAARTAAPWQVLLDLLEERTDGSYSDLWLSLVVTSEQAPQLTERQAARGEYTAVVASAGTWELPTVIRTDMSAWRFAAAEGLIGAAASVLDERDAITTQAANLGLTPPPTLRIAFETGNDLEAARTEARSELDALSAIGAAQSAIRTAPSSIEWVGLLFSAPDATLAAARTAFQAGDVTAAAADANQARSLRAEAGSAGRLRVLAGGGAILAADGAVMLILVGRRRAKRREAARLLGAQPPVAAPESAGQDAVQP
jgi:hypothetical protein